jgi:hypothetical protein
MKHVFSIILFLILSAIGLYLPTPTFALEGSAGGPCMPSHDTPTIGSYRNGDSNTQTYSNKEGKKITRICAATKWSNGKIDHLSHYANYSDECYQISGLGTSTVTVKRVSETYAVPAWQTGSEAGKCQPLDHLDIFLAAPASTPTPTPSPTATTSTQTTTSGSSNTANPTPSPTSTSSPTATLTSGNTTQNVGQQQHGQNAPATTTNTAGAGIVATATQGEVLGTTQEEGASPAATLNPSTAAANQSPQTWLTLLRQWWWLLLIVVVIGLVGWYLSRPDTSNE